MARRPIHEEDDVSLFPFLSIIAAIIGVLTLMIAAVTLQQLNQEDVKEQVDNMIEMDEIKQKLVSYKGEVEKLKLKMGAEQAAVLRKKAERQQELVKTQAELKRLQEQLLAAKEKIEEDKKIKIVIPEIPPDQRETLLDMQAELELVKKRLAVLNKELIESKKSTEAQVSILPSGSGLSFKPKFIECSSNSLVLHTENPPLRIRRGETAASPEFVKLMEKVANSKNQTVILLIRPDGTHVYNHLKRILDEQGVRNGKLPVIGNGELDFSHFRDL